MENETVCKACGYKYTQKEGYQPNRYSTDEPFIEIVGDIRKDMGTWTTSISLLACPKCFAVQMKDK